MNQQEFPVQIAEGPAPLQMTHGEALQTETGQMVEFAAQSVDEDKAVIWEFQDGQTLEGQIVQRSFLMPGTYYVIMKTENQSIRKHLNITNGPLSMTEPGLDPSEGTGAETAQHDFGHSPHNTVPEQQNMHNTGAAQDLSAKSERYQQSLPSINNKSPDKSETAVAPEASMPERNSGEDNNTFVEQERSGREELSRQEAEKRTADQERQRKLEEQNRLAEQERARQEQENANKRAIQKQEVQRKEEESRQSGTDRVSTSGAATTSSAQNTTRKSVGTVKRGRCGFVLPNDAAASCVIWSDTKASITISPHKWIELEQAYIITDGPGQVRISISGGGISKSIHSILNNGRTTLTFAGLDELEPGVNYTLSISPSAGTELRKPRIANYAACPNGSNLNNNDITIDYSNSTILFDLKYSAR